MTAIENITNQLKTHADRATSDGMNYEFDGWADEHGYLVGARQDDGYRVECWWDDQDPSNPGYAYRAARYEDGERLVGEEESGEL